MGTLVPLSLLIIGGNMNIQIPDNLRKMIGLKCCAAKLTLDKGLRIEFGKQVFRYYSKGQGKEVFRGEWDLISKWSSWRVVQDSRIACSACDGEEFSEPLVKSLLIGKLQNIIQESTFDLSLVFDNGVKVEFFGISDTDCAIEVWCSDNIFVEFIAGQGWTEKTSTSCEGLTKDEELLANHSEKFHQRWGDLVPQNENCSFCMECGFFMPIAGKFYFWDYGLCSNEASNNDGKLVGVKSGCKVFSKSIIKD